MGSPPAAIEQLFAPWRIEWVRREERPGDGDTCVFCALLEVEADREHLVVARSTHCYVLLNNYPYNPGHVMVIPHTHTGRFDALDAETLTGLERTTQATVAALERAFDPDGFNLGMNLGSAAAGGSIGDHLHRHVVPRWAGDTNFMPVIGDTKVIVEALESTYEHLHAAFADAETAVEDPATGQAVRLRQG